MTASAGNSDVGPFELKGRIAVVIEIAGLPVRRRVAATAIDLRLIFDHDRELTGVNVSMATRAVG
jgi:hypothetical protein